MDRRLILALTLGVGVILLSNVLFPPPKSAPGGRDSTAVTTAVGAGAAGATSSAASAAPSAAASAATPASPSTTGAAGANPGAITGATAAPAAVPETLVVMTPKATYRLSTFGATIVGASMADFASLTSGARATPGTPRVELVRPREALFSYGVVVPGDTLPLAGVPFTAARSSDASGETITFTGAAGNGTVAATVTIAYTFPRDTAKAYRALVRASVAGVAGNPYLLVGMPAGLALTESDPAEAATHTAYAWHRKGGDASLLSFGKLDPGETRLEPGPHTWVVAKSKYFVVGALGMSEAETPFEEVHFAGGVRTEKVALNGVATVVTSLKGGNAAWELFIGPQEWKRLLAVGRDFENANPYGGWLQGVVQPFATIVMRILLWMKQTTQLNYGWVLVIFGLAVRLVLWPLNQSAMRTSIRMQRISPELQAVQAKFKSDPQKMQAEVMKVYAAHGLSPFSAFSGCLPMLLPLPVLFALFFVFQNTIEFRGVSFLWLPDISMKDPFYIIPLAMGATMYLLSWIGMRNAPPNPQAKLMSWLFPIMMTFLFLNFASGLNLYYTIQNLAALPQQWLLANERGKEAARVKG
jgi:YidC/Oxa1 family membrane protein insertase